MKVGDVLFTILCWILGLMVTAKTDWMVQHARNLQEKYPRAFTMRMADRKWYPTFLRVMGLCLLLFAALWTAVFVAEFWADRLVHK